MFLRADVSILKRMQGYCGHGKVSLRYCSQFRLGGSTHPGCINTAHTTFDTAVTVRRVEVKFWLPEHFATNGCGLQKQVLGLFFPLGWLEKQPHVLFAFRHVQCVLSV